MASIPGDNNHIFDAHAKLTCKVDARLDSDDHTWHEGLRLVRGDAGWFVDLKSDAMASGMSEELSQTGLAQDTSRCFVNLSASNSRTNGCDRSLLSLPHSIIREPLAARWLTEEDSARHIRAITFEDNTEIQSQEASTGQRPGSRLTVGEGRSWAAGDDGWERHRLSTSHPGAPFQRRRYFKFRHSGMYARQQLEKEVYG
jgi:hypothetical protein